MGRFTGNLPDRTFQFAAAVTDLVDLLPHNVKGWVFGRQLLKSGTSVGANTEEADCALTDREFAQFCNIARRESAETRYWTRLCIHRNLLPNEEATPVMNEADQLVRIFSTIIRKTRGDDAENR